MTGLPDGTERRPDGAAFDPSAFVVAGLLAALGALLVWEGMHIPDRGGYSGVGPGDVPKLVGYGLLALAVWTGIAGLRAAPEARAPQELPPVLWIVGGLFLQLVLLKLPAAPWQLPFAGLTLPGFPWWFPQGFAIASGLLFACTAAAFGKRNLLLTLPVGIVFALAVYGVFDRILQLNLPAGPLETLIFDNLGRLIQTMMPGAATPT